MSDIISKVKNLFSSNQTKEETEDKSSCSCSLDDEFSEDLFDEDEIKELEESRKLLNDLSKDLKTKAIENINFNSYFGEIDEKYVKSKFVKYIKDFYDNYHIDSSDPFSVYVENDIIFRMGLVLRIFETRNNDGHRLGQSPIDYVEIGNCRTTKNYGYIIDWDNIRIDIAETNERCCQLFDKLHFDKFHIELKYLYSYCRDGYNKVRFNSQRYLEDHKECKIKFDSSMQHLLRITDIYQDDNFIIVITSMNPSEIYRIINIKDYDSIEFKNLLASEINSLLLTISDCKLPTFSKFSLEGLNFQKLNLKNKSIEESISTNLKRNEELENQIKNKEIQIYNLNKQIDDLEQTYKSFKRFEDFQGFFEDTSVSEYQKLKQVEHDYQEYQKRSDEMKAYDEIIQNFEIYRNEFIIKSRNYSKLMKKYFQDKKQKLKIKEEELENKFEEMKNELENKYQDQKRKLKEKEKEYDKAVEEEMKKWNKAINDANDKQKYWQNIIDHAEEHITSKLQKQLQEQITQFSKFNSAKWDSQVSFNIISTILKAINHKNDLIKLGIETDELEFKNLNEVLKCIQIFNMFGLCTNDKNENVLMNKFTFNFIDKINSYMKQFSVLDPDYKK